MIKCLLTELGRAGRENIWPSVMAHGPRCARSVRHDLGPNIFLSGPPTQSISTYDCGHGFSRMKYEAIQVAYYYIQVRSSSSIIQLRRSLTSNCFHPQFK